MALPAGGEQSRKRVPLAACCGRSLANCVGNFLFGNGNRLIGIVIRLGATSD